MQFQAAAHRQAVIGGIPDAKKVIMSGVGHMSNMENAKQFNEIVLEFLAGK
jgi:pimeloyl-ACP methyl ester carboxylesterase